MNIKKFLSAFGVSVLGVFLMTTFAVAAATYSQGFETDASGWFDTDDAWFGDVSRVASGTNGIVSFEGDWHAIVAGDETSAPFSRFDGYRDTWTGQWIAEVSVYLDPAWEAGTGFDYSVAANGSDGNHQRDYIFHVTSDTSTGELLVAGSNNTNFAPREDLENINHYTVEAAGWYTLQHVFYESAGALAVDMNLLDAADNVVFTETRFNAADTIPAEVGGNRYAWFTFINVDGGIAVDSHELFVFERTAEITAPTSGEDVSGMVDFAAMLHDDDMDAIQWAVRQGTCAAGVGTVFGNVDGHSDVATIDTSDPANQTFVFTGDMTEMTPGMYCFIYNPVEDNGETNIRETVEFNLTEVLVGPPVDKNECKDGGWEAFNNPEFDNQGECVSYVVSNEHAGKRN